MSDYSDPDNEVSLSAEELRAAEPDVQRAVMEAWFRARFEDPAERTPYESAEGGYQWIWGGPYEAREELENEFSGTVPEEVIEELAEDLHSECWQWAPTPKSDDYDEYLVDDIARITSFLNTFSDAILDIESLLQSPIPGPAAGCYLRLLYVNVITALETYLSDAFISTVVNDPVLMRRFIETTPEFQSEKVPLAEVFKAVEDIERKARTYLFDVVWHHLERIKPMYRDTLGVSFPKDIGAIFRAILKRHDIVHRNGKTKDGKDIQISGDDIRSLIKEVEAFVTHVDGKLAAHRKPREKLPGEGDGEP